MLAAGVPSKQLEILVTARDQASGVFRQVGDSAEGLSGKLGGLNELAETGHGMHHLLRSARNIFIAFEVIPAATEAVKAAWATLSGTAEQAAEGQRALYNAIKEIPLVGKPAAEAAEWLGAKIAHAFGSESTAEIEAETAKKKQILEDFARDMEKLTKDVGKSDDQVAMIGLLPGEAAIEKAKEDFKHKMDDLKKVKADAIKRAGEDIEQSSDASNMKDRLLMGGGDVDAEAKKKLEAMKNDLARANADIAREEANQKKLLAFATDQAHAKQLDEENQFSESLQEAQRKRADLLESLAEGLHQRELEADNRGFEARQANLKSQNEKEVRHILQAADEQRRAIEKRINDLTPSANSGDAAAQKQIEAWKQQQAQNEQFLGQAVGAAQDGGAARLSQGKDDQLRQSRLKILQDEAAAGDAAAKTSLRKMEYDKEMDATAKALLAIVKDTASTDQQRVEAKRQLNELDKANKEHAAQESANAEQALRRANLEILQKEAAAGDAAAAAQLLQLQRQQEQLELRKQLLAIEQADPNSKEGKEAHRQLQGLDALGGKQTDADLNAANLDLLQKEGQLGDQNAAREARKLELQKQYNEERAKLLAIENDANSTQEQKEKARKILGGLDAAEKKAEAGLGGGGEDKSADHRATLEAAQYLTGVSAKAAQEKEDPMRPVVEAQKEQTGVMKTVVDLLKDFLHGQRGVKQPVYVR